MSDPTASPHERAPGYATPSYATTARAASAHPSTAVLAYAEGLLRGRRIAVLGEATHDTAEKVIERGARLVHVYDPDPARVAVAMAALAAHAGRGAARPVIAQLTDDLGVRDGAFDVVLVPDLTLFEDAGAVVRRVRRLLSPQGVGIFASPNPDAKHALYRTRSGARSVDTALSYYDLYDAVSLQFPEVRMLGQAPFVGYAIVDFAEQNPDVAVDTTAVDEPAAPEWYVAIASQRRVELDAYSLVELPLDDVIGREPSQEPVTVPREAAARDLAASAATALPDRQVELTEAKARIAVLLRENETLREQVTQLARAERTAELANARLLELERDAAFLAGRTNAAEAARDEARLRAETAEALVERERARLTSTEIALDVEREQNRQATDEVTRLNAELARVLSELTTERQARSSDAARHAEEALADKVVTARTVDELRARVVELEGQLAAADPPTLRSKEMQQQRIQALEAQRAELVAREDELVARARELSGKLRTAELERETLTKKIGQLETRAASAATAAALAEERQRIAQDRERAASERERAAADREKATQERERAATEREKTTQERERITAELERLATERAESARERERSRERERVEQEEIGKERAKAANAVGRATELDRQLTEERERAAALEAEVTALERTLRSRGHEVSQLQRDMRETERVGRELLFELLALKTSSSNNGGGADSSGQPGAGSDGAGASGSQGSAIQAAPAIVSASPAFDSELAERAARAEADLLSATWKIARLERELTKVSAASSVTPDVHVKELGRAIASAERELGRMRREHAATAEIEARVVEQAVLIEQLAGALHLMDAAP